MLKIAELWNYKKQKSVNINWLLLFIRVGIAILVYSHL